MSHGEDLDDGLHDASAEDDRDLDDGDMLCVNPTLELWLDLVAQRDRADGFVGVPLTERDALRRVAAVLDSPDLAAGAHPIACLRAAAPARADQLVADHGDLDRRAIAIRISCARRTHGRVMQRVFLDGNSLPLLQAILTWVAADADELHPGETLTAEQLHELLSLGVIQFVADVPRPVVYEPRLTVDAALAADAASFWPLGDDPGSDRPATDRVVNSDITSSADGLAVTTVSPRTGMATSYRLEPHLASTIAGLRDGSLAITELTIPVQRALAGADVVVHRDAADRGRRLRDQARRDLASGGYAVLRGVISPAWAANLRAYVRDLRREGYLVHGDPQVPEGGREILHNEPVMRALHDQLAELVGAVVTEPIKPSYSILGYYPPGAILRRHVDRAQCAWNVSLAIDYAPDVAAERLWPLCFDVDGQVAEARLAIGDAALYRGTETPHWRPAQPDGQTSAFTFFHFVPADFTGSLE